MIRDFVYLDADRLYSLYSQVFEGVAERIVRSYVDELTSGRAEQGGLLRGGSADSGSRQASQRTEDRLLHDHLYAQLEAKIADQLVEVAPATFDRLDELAPGRMVTVRGVSTIEDFADVARFLSEFNTLGEVLAHARLWGLGDEAVKELATDLGVVPPPAPRGPGGGKVSKVAAAPNHRDALARHYAEIASLHLDQQMLDRIAWFVKQHLPNEFSVVVARDGDVTAPVVRAFLDRRWLRTSPDLLRALSGGRTVSRWTVVGMVTHRTEPPITEAVVDEGGDSFRDKLSQMARLTGNLYNMLYATTRSETFLAPVAVYQEVDLRPIPAAD